MFLGRVKETTLQARCFVSRGEDCVSQARPKSSCLDIFCGLAGWVTNTAERMAVQDYEAPRVAFSFLAPLSIHCIYVSLTSSPWRQILTLRSCPVLHR